MEVNITLNRPKFSIVIPAYNAEKFISSAIESVLNQTYEDWELILIENGSTDNTTKICKNFLTDKRIKLFHSEKGVSKARNVGINQAKGFWLIFLDADDQLLSDALESYLKIDKLYSPELIIGEYTDNAADCSLWMTKEYVGESLRNILLLCLENPNQKCNVTAVAFRTSVIRNNNIWFDYKINYAEDSVFFLNVLNYAKKVVTFCYPVYHYVYSSQSTIRSGKKKLDREYIPAIKKIKNIIDVSDPMIKNGWYIFILNQLLIIFVNDIFSRKKIFIRQMKDAKKVMEIEQFKIAIYKSNISKIQGLKKIVFKMMKLNCVFGLMIASKIRQRQNKKKENQFYV
ncbi:glycosyltransferase family 2 protein [Aerococcus urinae]|uniref:glycosyltransferase family 2 protein n=1 Tax=Aerococcus urinae TaxID=1376 RepID=UPI00254E4AFE|nr:glycosyltransferase family A protein [Aerococcus urinae]MDK6374581.1 glycosyltransferase family A protein [Aerococcus urinae]MDK6420349.1 glycosyltransferase family A protein [Aerococcus urinae]MDK8075217.1 glycosyltransferase family A protein [Aerococcus urinae]MDK8084830.1 glycosyltransferase family A protein [Aerococcus urinae]